MIASGSGPVGRVESVMPQPYGMHVKTLRRARGWLSRRARRGRTRQASSGKSADACRPRNVAWVPSTQIRTSLRHVYPDAITRGRPLPASGREASDRRSRFGAGQEGAATEDVARAVVDRSETVGDTFERPIGGTDMIDDTVVEGRAIGHLLKREEDRHRLRLVGIPSRIDESLSSDQRHRIGQLVSQGGQSLDDWIANRRETVTGAAAGRADGVAAAVGTLEHERVQRLLDAPGHAEVVGGDHGRQGFDPHRTVQQVGRLGEGRAETGETSLVESIALHRGAVQPDDGPVGQVVGDMLAVIGVPATDIQANQEPRRSGRLRRRGAGENRRREWSRRCRAAGKRQTRSGVGQLPCANAWPQRRGSIANPSLGRRSGARRSSVLPQVLGSRG